MPKRYYEEFEVGDVAEAPVGRTVSETDIYRQAGLSGYYAEHHTNREYMKDTQYGEPIAQNTLLLSVIEGLTPTIPEWDPATIAAYGRDGVRFLEPVFAGDTLSLELEIADKRPHEQGGVIHFGQDLYNQDDDLVVTGAYLLLVERESEDKG